MYTRGESLLPWHSKCAVDLNICVGAIANRGEQGCSLPMATDLGPVRATSKKKKIPEVNYIYLFQQPIRHAE